jgi:hypothetical protein
MGVISDEDSSFVWRCFGSFKDGGCFATSEYGVDGNVFFFLDGLNDRGLLEIENDRHKYKIFKISS